MTAFEIKLDGMEAGKKKNQTLTASISLLKLDAGRELGEG